MKLTELPLDEMGRRRAGCADDVMLLSRARHARRSRNGMRQAQQGVEQATLRGGEGSGPSPARKDVLQVPGPASRRAEAVPSRSALPWLTATNMGLRRAARMFERSVGRGRGDRRPRDCAGRDARHSPRTQRPQAPKREAGANRFHDQSPCMWLRDCSPAVSKGWSRAVRQRSLTHAEKMWTHAERSRRVATLRAYRRSAAPEHAMAALRCVSRWLHRALLRFRRSALLLACRAWKR